MPWAKCRSPTANNEPVTLDIFKQFLSSTFGAIALEKQARAQYKNLYQTGSAYAYVIETRKLVQQMQHDPHVCLSEADVIEHFISNAKPELRNYLITQTPDSSYYANSAEVFLKATNWCTNQRSMAHAAAVPHAPKILANMEFGDKLSPRHKLSSRKARRLNHLLLQGQELGHLSLKGRSSTSRDMRKRGWMKAFAASVARTTPLRNAADNIICAARPTLH